MGFLVTLTFLIVEFPFLHNKHLKAFCQQRIQPVRRFSVACVYFLKAPQKCREINPEVETSCAILLPFKNVCCTCAE